MISQMRIHQKKIEKVLHSLPMQGEQWQLWLAYHEYQMSYFQKNREAYLMLEMGMLVATIVSFCLAFMDTSGWVWLMALVSAVGLVAVAYYLWQYNDLLHRMEEQTEELFEKTLSIETKPNWTMAKYWLDLAGHLVSGWAAKKRAWLESDDE